MVLFKRFDCKSNSVKLVRRPISEGMGPVKELEYKERIDRPVKYPISVGIVPFKEFIYKSNSVKLVRRPISEGIGPFNEFENK